jgi:hypothetical protein
LDRSERRFLRIWRVTRKRKVHPRLNPYLALKSGAGILPVCFTGTANAKVYGSLKHFHRPQITLQVGKLFFLEDQQPGRFRAWTAQGEQQGLH